MSKVIDVHVKNLRKIGYKNLKHWLENPNHIYIWRRNVYVDGTYQSKWHNPFPIKNNREKSLDKYKKYIKKNKELINQLNELDGKILGCWCKPSPCHGDILVKLLKKM